MAKGDATRARNQIDTQGGLAQNNLTNLRENMIIPQAQAAQNNYTRAADRSFQDYGDIMGQYNKFATTGGFSPTDIAAIRARAIAPTRAVYANANQAVNRQKAIQGGYSPGFGTLKARMARDMSSGLSDANTNAEAQIAQLINSGKQFGTSGATSLFGTSPGLASHFGGMQNQTMNNWLQAQGLQNQLGLGLIGAQIDASKIPGKGQQAFNNILAGVGTAANAIGSVPW
jgi:hypothetical protein